MLAKHSYEASSRRIEDIRHVFIVGGGIGGVYTALNLIREGVNPHGITVVAELMSGPRTQDIGYRKRLSAGT